MYFREARCYLAREEQNSPGGPPQVLAWDDLQEPAGADLLLLLLYPEGDVPAGVVKPTRAAGALAHEPPAPSFVGTWCARSAWLVGQLSSSPPRADAPSRPGLCAGPRSAANFAYSGHFVDKIYVNSRPFVGIATDFLSLSTCYWTLYGRLARQRRSASNLKAQLLTACYDR
jgi:hypothetical protein